MSSKLVTSSGEEAVPHQMPPGRPTEAPTPAGRWQGPAAALLIIGWMLATTGQADAKSSWAALGCGVAAFLLLLRPFPRLGLLLTRHAAHALVVTVAMCLLIPLVDRLLASWEERVPRFGVASSVASVFLKAVGYRVAAERGDLLVDHPDGLITVVPSMEKLAIRPLMLLWAVWLSVWLVRDGRRPIAVAILGLGMTSFMVLLRYIIFLLIYFEHDNILVGNTGLAALNLFESRWIAGFFALAAGLALEQIGRSSVRGLSTTGPGFTRLRIAIRAGAAMALLGALVGLAWSISPVGREKGGRVLIDDRFCGIWEPTARQLDDRWYGDFSTYSFTSLAEWLGKWFSVDVNIGKPYDDELLSRYDVLVVKTPEEPIPDVEVAAIERFVVNGGGLLLVGDHTNLLGMGTHLNVLSAKHGIRFRYDAVSDGESGGFVRYQGPMIGRHVGALHVDKLEFMTSCSIQLTGDAQAVVAAEGCRRDPHDYAGSSFFGRSGAHPELEQGRMVLAATVRVGRGRIAAFTDSTIWSSFAVFQWDREKLAMDLVRLLDREASTWEPSIKSIAITASILAVLSLLASIRSGVALAALLGILLGVWSGMLSSDRLHRSIYAWSEPNAPIAEVSFLWQGGACAFPPVLGSLGSLPVERCFDTLLVAVQRLGLAPHVAYFYEDMIRKNTVVIFAVAPVNKLPEADRARLREFVRGGGCLVVMDDVQAGTGSSTGDIFAIFDVPLTYHGTEDQASKDRPHAHLGGGMSIVRAPDADSVVATKPFGRGRVVYMSDALNYSRQGLGHCFSRPSIEAKSRYETIYFVLRDILAVAPRERRYYGIVQ